MTQTTKEIRPEHIELAKQIHALPEQSLDIVLAAIRILANPVTGESFNAELLEILASGEVIAELPALVAKYQRRA